VALSGKRTAKGLEGITANDAKNAKWGVESCWVRDKILRVVKKETPHLNS
jgi:hypothetical protein